MTILPLIIRELRVRARNPATFWARCLVGLAGVLLSLSTMTTATAVRAAQGQAVFTGLVLTAFILSCASCFAVVDGVSRQQKEGTLGLLLLTPVRPWEVLVGSFGSVGISYFCNLAALTPLVVIPLLAGGVTVGEAVRMVLVLFDTIGISLAVGLWAAAPGRGWARSAGSAALLLGCILAGPTLRYIAGPAILLKFFSPVYAMDFATDSTYRRFPQEFWTSLALIHGVSWLLLLSAGKRFKDALRRQGEADSAISWLRRLSAGKRSEGEAGKQGETKIAGEKPKRTRRRIGWGDPIQWRMREQKGMWAIAWAIMILSVAFENGFIIVAMWSIRLPAVGPVWFNGMNVGMAMLRAGVIGWVASRFFITARGNGELELLLTTPLGARGIVAGQWAFLRRIFFWPTVVLVAPALIQQGFYLWPQVAMALGTWHAYGVSVNVEWVHQLGQMLFFSANRVAAVGAALWLGIWFGYSAASPTKAVVRVVALTTFAPLVLGLFVVRPGAPLVFNPASYAAWFIWPAAELYYFVMLIRWARRRLSRELHLERKPPGPSTRALLYQDLQVPVPPKREAH